jgi:hypothetical protein
VEKVKRFYRGFITKEEDSMQRKKYSRRGAENGEKDPVFQNAAPSACSASDAFGSDVPGVPGYIYI